MAILDGVDFNIDTSNTRVYNGTNNQDEIIRINNELKKEFQTSEQNDLLEKHNLATISIFTDEDVKNMIQQEPLLKESSKVTTYNKMMAAKNFVKAESLYDLMLNPMLYGQNIVESELTLNTKKNHLVGILTLLKNSGAKRSHPKLYSTWYKYFIAINRVILTLIGTNTPTERQAKNAIKWETIIQVRDRLKFGSYDHLLMSMYTMVPPRRQWDYMQMPVYLDPEYNPELDHNHLHVKNNKHQAPYMFIIDCKNAEYFNPFFNKEIPKKLVKTLLLSMKDRPRSYVFTQNNGKGQPFDNTNSFQKFSNRAFKRIFKDDPMFTGDSSGVSVNVLRHSFATYINEQADIPVATKKRLAIKMGHSYNTHIEHVLLEERRCC